MEAGYSPSPYSSPLKGEETFLRLLRSARNDSKKRARNDREGRIATPSARNDSKKGARNDSPVGES